MNILLVLMEDKKSPMEIINDMMEMIRDKFLLEIVITLALLAGFLLMIKAIVDTARYMAGRGANGSGIKLSEIIVCYFFAGLLLLTSGISGFAFIEWSRDVVAHNAVELVNDGFDGNSSVKDGIDGSGGGGAWDG